MTTEYKIGDKFRVICDKSAVTNRGDILTLISIEPDSMGCFTGSSVHGRQKGCCVYFERLEKIDNDKKQPTEDKINSPSHYTQGEIDCIDAIRAVLTTEGYRGFLRGNIMKYNWRMGLKGKATTDAEKCQWYNNKLIESLKEKE